MVQVKHGLENILIYICKYTIFTKKMIPKEMWEDLVHGCKNGKMH